MTGSSLADDAISLPDDAAVEAAISDFARAVRKAYGPRVRGIYLFGSRARGDHTKESDADIAVVLADGESRSWAEMKRLADIAYDFIVSTGAGIEAWPVPESAWKDPGGHVDEALFAAMRRDARPIEVPDG